VKHAADNVFQIASPLPQIIILKTVVGFVQFLADLPDCPLGVDGPLLDGLHNSIHEKLVLEDQQMRVNQE